MRFKALAALAAAAVLAGCGKKPNVPTSRSAVVGPASLRDVARLTGTVEPADTIQVKSEVTQQIKRILVKEGEFVKKGQLLFDLDREQLQLKHEQLVIAVSTAELSLKSAGRDLERAQVQIKNGSVSADHVQDLEITRDKAKLALQNAQLDLKSNNRDLANTKITAPRDGQLIRLSVSEGEMAVAASSASGNVLAVVADPTRLKVVVEVSELDFPRLKLGQKVEISTESQADKLLQGVVSYIPPSAQASSSNSSVMVFKVEVTLVLGAKPQNLSEVAGGSKRHRFGGEGGPDSTRLQHSGKRDSRHEGGGDSAKAAAWKKMAKDREATAEKINTSLVPGMTVNVDFVFVERKVDLAVPYDMVSTAADGATKIVWVRGKPNDGEEKVRRRPSALAGDFHPKRIQAGSTDFKNYEILYGLSAGDTIFAAPDTSSKSSKKGGPGGPP